MGEINYQSNSLKSREAKKPSEDKRVAKAVTTNVKTKKPGIVGSIVSEEAHNVGRYLISEVVVPTVKDFIVDLITDGVNLIFKGTTGRKSSGSRSYVSYSKNTRAADDRRYGETRGRFDYADYVIEDRGEAEEVIDRMCELLETYQVVRVADFFDLIGKTCEYTDNKYGWYSLGRIEAVRVNGGYIIKLPRPTPVD